MDLSLLYFFLPRLSESRKVLSRNILFDGENRKHHIHLKNPLPCKRRNQRLRMVISEDIHGSAWRRLVYEKPEDLVSIVGVVSGDMGDRAVRRPFKWAQTSGGSVDFRADNFVEFDRIEIECEAPAKYDFIWVCSDRTSK